VLRIIHHQCGRRVEHTSILLLVGLHRFVNLKAL
jgi:hypothetical protein